MLHKLLQLLQKSNLSSGHPAHLTVETSCSSPSLVPQTRGWRSWLRITKPEQHDLIFSRTELGRDLPGDRVAAKVLLLHLVLSQYVFPPLSLKIGQE
jgi:hypothetical protein